jgi:hypothetical protein
LYIEVLNDKLFKKKIIIICLKCNKYINNYNEVKNMAQNPRGLKNGWYLVALLLIFGLAGAAIGELITSNASQLSFISKSMVVGMTNPLELNLHFIRLTFGISFNVNIASLAGMLIGFFIYKKL